MYSNVTWVTTGAINKVNDAAIAQQAGQSFGPGSPNGSKFAGQLGAVFEWRDAEVMFDSAIGTVYGGQFQYVRLDPSAGPVALGQLVYWDDTVDFEDFQVTDDGTKTTLARTLGAGIVLNPNWTAGNYSFIQIVGPVDMLFDASITGTAEIGRPVFADAGTDGAVDVLDVVDGPALARHLGTAIELPVAGAVSLVQLDPHNVRR